MSEWIAETGFADAERRITKCAVGNCGQLDLRGLHLTRLTVDLIVDEYKKWLKAAPLIWSH